MSDSSLSPQLLAVNTEHAQFMSKGMHARMNEHSQEAASHDEPPACLPGEF